MRSKTKIFTAMTVIGWLICFVLALLVSGCVYIYTNGQDVEATVTKIDHISKGKSSMLISIRYSFEDEDYDMSFTTASSRRHIYAVGKKIGIRLLPEYPWAAVAGGELNSIVVMLLFWIFVAVLLSVITIRMAKRGRNEEDNTGDEQ